MGCTDGTLPDSTEWDMVGVWTVWTFWPTLILWCKTLLNPAGTEQNGGHRRRGPTLSDMDIWVSLVVGTPPVARTGRTSPSILPYLPSVVPTVGLDVLIWHITVLGRTAVVDQR